jgi:iron complex transport system ATP-binding protein
VNVRVHGLSFSYGGFALDVPALSIGEARVTALVGPNGAGKSTLLKCLAGVLRTSRGTVLAGGRARLVGYVPQEPAPTFNYAVLDFVLMGRAAFIPAFGTPSHGDLDAAHEALRYVGLDGFGPRPVLELSSGERRLALIARTLAQRPAVLLLDEPTTFLDPRHEVGVMELLDRLAAEGRTVVVSLHALDMALKYADDIVVLKDGKPAAAGRPDDVLDEGLLGAVFGTPMRLREVDGRRVVLR